MTVIRPLLLFAGCFLAASIPPGELAAAARPTPAEGAAAARDGIPSTAEQKLCELIEAAAQDNRIPVRFFTRLLWKESSFRSDAVSPKGAQGIAQFMPATAVERGLADPFDVATAVAASAHLLADLEARFGNLGLAAAAYNAGAERVTNWLADTATLPLETQDYVLWITGDTAENWAEPIESAAESVSPEIDDDCLTVVAALHVPGVDIGPEIETANGPWGTQVAGNFSRARAIATYTALQQRFPSLLADRLPMLISGRMAGRGNRAFHQVRVPAQSREEAEDLCDRLQREGASCVVLKT